MLNHNNVAMARITEDATLPKSIAIMDALGNVDELNAALGLSGSEFDEIQSFLSEIMGYIYGRSNDEERIKEEIAALGRYIEESTAISVSVNPRGYLPLARAICRRAERGLVKLNVELRESGEYEYNTFPIVQYLDRLGDFLTVKISEAVRDQMPVKIPLRMAA